VLITRSSSELSQKKSITVQDGAHLTRANQECAAPRPRRRRGGLRGPARLDGSQGVFEFGEDSVDGAGGVDDGAEVIEVSFEC